MDASALDTFTQALFDRHQRQHGLKPTWATVKEATRVHWRRCVAVAAENAWRSQFSPLARERILNAPDPYRVFAMGLAQALGASRSKARTLRGIQRAVRAAGGEAFSLWVEAINDGVRALLRARNIVQDGSSNALVQQLDDLRSAA